MAESALVSALRDARNFVGKSITAHNKDKPSVLGNLLTGQSWNQGINRFGGKELDMNTFKPKMASNVISPLPTNQPNAYQVQSVTPTPTMAPQRMPTITPTVSPVASRRTLAAKTTPTPSPQTSALSQAQVAVKKIRDAGKGQGLSDKQIMDLYSKHGEKLLAGIAQPSPSPTFAPAAPGRWQYKGADLPKPPPQMVDIVKKIFGPDADDALAVAASENGTFQPDRDSPPNLDGSVDRGWFQININTFNGLMKRRPDLMRQAGITSYEEMKDPIKNTLVAKMVYDEGGWGRWYGPSRVGLQLQ